MTQNNPGREDSEIVPNESDDDKVTIYHRVYEDEDVSETADALWSLLQDAHEEFPDSSITLALDIEGHRNAEGGFTDGFFNFQKNVCLTLIAPFVDVLILPLGDHAYDTSNLTLEHTLERDRERVEEEEGEEIAKGQQHLTDPSTLSSEKVLQESQLLVDLDDDSGSLQWGLAGAASAPNG